MLKDEISSGVSDRLELFADIPGDASDYCKTAEAFTNTFGGKIVFGVSPDGCVKGIGGYIDRFAAKIQNDIISSSGNMINPNVYRCSLGGTDVIVAEIPRSMKRPVDSYGGLIRSGDSNHKLSLSSRKDLTDESNPMGVHHASFMASIECARIRGSTVIDRRSFLGRPADILRPAVLFVTDHINISTVDGEDRFEIPLGSIREFIINALKHRSYNHERSIQINIYDEKIDIISPGMFAYGLSADDALNGCKRCRNSELAESLDSDECIGLSAAFSLCKEYGLIRPSIVQENESVKVTVHRIRSLPDSGSMSLMAYFRGHPDASIADASESLGMSIAITRNAIEELRSKGMLHREGSKKFGHWVISS